MSDRHDTIDHENADVLGLLDRAGELSPLMAVRPEAVIVAGRQKVRRRRASAVGAGTVVLAMAGALWIGGPLDPFTDSQTLAPAAISWHDGVNVDLFDNQPHPSEVGRSHWTGELRSSEGETLPQLVLTQDGKQLEPIQAEDGPGEVMLFRTEGLSVAAWQRPPGSIGEAPVWSPGSEASQGSSIKVGDGKLNYAVAEFVPGATGELEELYWFSQGAGHAASGSVVSSAVLRDGDTSVVVMVDEPRGTWGMVHAEDPVDNFVHTDPLRAHAGVSGWAPGPLMPAEGGDPAPAPADVVPTSVGVLPPGASLSESSEGTTQVHASVGAHTAVLAADPTAAAPPPIRFALNGDEHNLSDYATSVQLVSIAGTDVHVDATPDGLQLFVAPGQVALIPTEDLLGDGAVVGAVGDGQVVVVPGWEPQADATDLRIQVGAEEWLPVDSALAGTLFNGTPLMVLGLDAPTLAEDVTVARVGVVDGDEITPHELKGGSSRVDLDL